MTARATQGFSLLEMMIVVAILGVMVLAILGSLSTGTATYDCGIAFEELSTSSLTLFLMLTDDIQHGRVIGVGNFGAGVAHSAIAVQVPIDWDQDGDVVDAGNSIEWGCRDDRVVYVGGYVVYAFRQESVQSEGVLGVDLNGDGDLGDRFAIGTVQRILRTAAGASVRQGAVAGRVMVRATAPGGGVPVADYNVESDSAAASSADPMFKLTDFGTAEDGTAESATGRVVTADVWFCQVDGSNRALRTNRRERFALRNSSAGAAPPVPNMNP